MNILLVGYMYGNRRLDVPWLNIKNDFIDLDTI